MPISSVGSGQIYQQFNYGRTGKVVMQRQSAGGSAFEIQYSYNPGGQLIEEWVRGEVNPPYYSLDEKRSFFYDVAGRLTNVNRGSHGDRRHGLWRVEATSRHDYLPFGEELGAGSGE